MRKEIRIKNQVEELDRVARFIEEIGEELGLDILVGVAFAVPESTQVNGALIEEVGLTHTLSLIHI